MNSKLPDLNKEILLNNGWGNKQVTSVHLHVTNTGNITHGEFIKNNPRGFGERRKKQKLVLILY